MPEGKQHLRVSSYVCISVCVYPRLLITSGVILTPYDWSNKFYGFYIAAVVGIISGRGLSMHTFCGN